MQTHSIDERRTSSRSESDNEQLLNSNAVRGRVGGVTNMCLWRWTNDERVMFPKPDIVINNRRYWRLGTIKGWEQSRLSRAA